MASLSALIVFSSAVGKNSQFHVNISSFSVLSKSGKSQLLFTETGPTSFISESDKIVLSQSTLWYTSLIALLYLGIFPTAVAFLLRFYIIVKAGPVFLSYVAYLIPCFAIILGFVFLGEKISNNILIGLLFILIGTFVGQKNTNVSNN